jgi:hypothetical protein
MNKSVAEIAAERWPQQKQAIALLSRGTSSPISSASGGAALVAGGVGDFISVMGAASASSALLNSGIQLLFGAGTGSATIQNLLASAANVTWLGEGQPISIRQFDTGMTVLAPKKLPTICVFSRDLFRFSTPNIESVVRTVLTESLGLALDASLLDAVTNDVTRPAGLRANIAALTASASATRSEAMGCRCATLVGAVAGIAGNGPIALVAAPAQAAALRLWARRDLVYPILASGSLAAGMVMAVAANALVSAADPAPRFSIADVAALHFDTARVTSFPAVLLPAARPNRFGRAI